MTWAAKMLAARALDCRYGTLEHSLNALGEQEVFNMSDEVISIEEVIAYSLDNFPDVIEDWNWGEITLL